MVRGRDNPKRVHCGRSHTQRIVADIDSETRPGLVFCGQCGTLLHVRPDGMLPDHFGWLSRWGWVKQGRINRWG